MATMHNFNRNGHSNKRRKKKRRRFACLESEKSLLVGFVASAMIVSISILIVPLNLEFEADLLPEHNQYHSNISQLKHEFKSSEKLSKKDSVLTKSSSTGRHDVKERDRNERDTEKYLANTASDNNNLDEKAYINEESFLSQSTPYHTIFSTGCSIFQDWQSYVFFYHVFRAGQEGHTTRIASGCRDGEVVKLQEMFNEEIKSMRPENHHLHFTPDYSRIPKKQKASFKYFNKPYGVRHWMKHALGYPENHKLHDDSIIILMDPDQIMLRPFTNDFTNSSEQWRSMKKRKLKVEHGSPFAQQYGYGVQWFNQINLTNVFQGINFPTPVSNLTQHDKMTYFFSMGPPYIATAKDLWLIVNKWSEIAPLVHNEYPHLLAEMFAYNLAVAHLGMRHTIAHSFMVSDPWAGGEGWKLIDSVPKSNICKNFPKSELPHVIHYCQHYYLGKWFIGKYRLRKDFISCEAPLLRNPPEDLASKYTTAMLPGKSQPKELKPKQAKEYAFMVCAMIDALNVASKFYKDQHCKDGNANYNYTYAFHDDMRMPNEQ